MNNTIYKWRFFCTTEQKWLYLWNGIRPIICNSCNKLIDQDRLNKEGKCGKVIYIYPAHSPFKLGPENFYVCDTNEGDIIFLLPRATDRVVFIKKVGILNSVIIKPILGETIDGIAMLIIQTAEHTVKLNFDTGGWISQDLSTTDGEKEIDGDIRNNDYKKNDMIIYDGHTHRALKNNFETARDPMITDDSTHNYIPGSGWINQTTNDHFILLNSDAGAAVWKKTTESLSHFGGNVALYTELNEPTRSTISVYCTHLSVHTADLAKKEYTVLWYFEIYNELLQGEFDAKVLLNGMVIGDMKDKTNNFSNNKKTACNGFVHRELSGINLIQIQYKNNNIAGSLVIQKCRLMVLF